MFNLKNALFFFVVSLPLPALAVEIFQAFSPQQGALTLVLTSIKEARETIDLAAYSFSSKQVSEALLDAKKRGVHVRVVADKKANNNSYTAVNFLANHGISVRLNGKHKIMHNKFIVIDAKSVQTGSFNYSAAADKSNAENVIYLRGAKNTATRYQAEFNRLWAESEPVQKRY